MTCRRAGPTKLRGRRYDPQILRSRTKIAKDQQILRGLQILRGTKIALEVFVGHPSRMILMQIKARSGSATWVSLWNPDRVALAANAGAFETQEPGLDIFPSRRHAFWRSGGSTPEYPQLRSV